jgi:hypothetical protein
MSRSRSIGPVLGVLAVVLITMGRAGEARSVAAL